VPRTPDPDTLTFQLALLIDGTPAATRIQRADTAAETATDPARRAARDLLDAARRQ